MTQTTMLFAHAGTDSHGDKSLATASAHDHGHDHAHTGHEIGIDDIHHSSGSSHPDMSGMECCGNSCTVDAQVLVCPFGSAQVARVFTGAKPAALTSADLSSPNPPPNTTF